MNVCTFSGNLGKDAENFTTKNGTIITNFSLAAKSGYGDNENTFWLNCKAFKRERLAQYLTKGSPVTVTGELNNRQYKDKEGNDRWSLELVIRDIVLPPRAGGGQQAQTQQAPVQDAKEQMGDAPF